MIPLTQEKGFNRETSQAFLRAGLRAIMRQPTVLSRWRAELSANTTSSPQEIAWIPGAESMAMLAAMPLEMRHATLATIGLTEAEQTLFHPIMDQLTGEAHATASRLLHALPYTAQTGALLGRNPHLDLPVTEAPFLPAPPATALSLAERQQALTTAQRAAFRALTLFQFPVPLAVIQAVLVAVGDTNPDETQHHLLTLELLLNQHEEKHNNLEHFITEPLAHPLFPPPLTPAEEKELAQAALPPLFVAWREEDGQLPWSILSLEAFRLAQLTGDPSAMEESAIAAGFWLFTSKHEARIPLAMVMDTVTALDAAQLAPSPLLLNLGMQCAAHLGESATRRTLLEQAMALPQSDTVDWAALWLSYADMLVMEGEIATAEQWLRRAEGVFQQYDHIRGRIVTMGLIADLLAQQGQPDAALRIQEERLAIAIQMGDLEIHAQVLFDMARLQLSIGLTDPKALQNVLDHLAHSFAMTTQIGHAKGMAVVGKFYGQLLAKTGQKEEAISVLTQSEAAFRLTQQVEKAQQIATLIQQIQNLDGTP